VQGSVTEARAAAASGLLGAVAIAIYFTVPAFTGWPYSGASQSAVSAYALSHQGLFFAGAWLQGTGTLLCVLFFLGVVKLAGGTGRVAGLAVVVASAALLSTVLLEGVLMVAVPLAAQNGDPGAAATAFALVNGVFARVYPIAPSTATYVSIGLVIRSSGLLPLGIAWSAIAIGAGFELGGVVALFLAPALIGLAVLGAAQAVWIVIASVCLWRCASG
jgi:hypothetical protein